MIRIILPLVLYGSLATFVTNSLFSSAYASYFAQINQDGFGSSHNTGGLEVQTMANFKNKLYVGVSNQTDGANLYAFDGKSWHKACESGFGFRENAAITALLATDTVLYAGTSNKSGGQVWCYDGNEWRCIHQGPFGTTLSKTISSMAFFQGRLFVGLWDQVTSKPTEVWAFDGEASWEQVNTPGFGSVYNLNTLALKVSRIDGSEKLYALVWKSFQYRGKDAGCDVWAYDGKVWQKVNEGREGFGEKGQGRTGIEPYSIAEFNGKIYVGTWAFEGGKYWEVWAYDGKDWELANSSVAGSGNELRLCIALTPFNGRLFAAVTDGFNKHELWVYDGKTWAMLIRQNDSASKGLGDPDNKVINAMAVYQGCLYLGVVNNKVGYRVFASRFPEISPKREVLSVGDAELFSLPGGTAPVKWHSSNPAVVTIDEAIGLAKSVGPGECFISATDNSGYAATPLHLKTDQTLEGKSTDKLFVFTSIDPFKLPNNNSDAAIVKAHIYLIGKPRIIDRVVADLSALHLGTKPLLDDGTQGDEQAGDNIYSLKISVPTDVPAGDYSYSVALRDQEGMEVKSTAAITVIQRYTPPEIISLKTLGDSDHIPILFAIKNPDRDECSVTVEYQSQGGLWQPASIESKSGTVFSKGVIIKLSQSQDVCHYACVWHSKNDINHQTGTFFIRVTPRDDTSSGSAMISPAIAVDNRKKAEDEIIYIAEGNFSIDKYEFPNRFGYYPEANLTWQEARKKCQIQGKDLCTPEQWEMAYYGKTHKHYPYGDTYGSKDRAFCNTPGSADNVATPSGIYENCVNDMGIYDMGGNLFEWVGLDEKNVFMADTSFMTEYMMQSLINVEDPTHRHYYLGFRCCKQEKNLQ